MIKLLLVANTKRQSKRHIGVRSTLLMESTRGLTSSSGNAGRSRIRDGKDDNANDSVDSSSSTIDKTMTIIIIIIFITI